MSEVVQAPQGRRSGPAPAAVAHDAVPCQGPASAPPAAGGRPLAHPCAADMLAKPRLVSGSCSTWPAERLGMRCLLSIHREGRAPADVKHACDLCRGHAHALPDEAPGLRQQAVAVDAQVAPAQLLAHLHRACHIQQAVRQPHVPKHVWGSGRAARWMSQGRPGLQSSCGLPCQLGSSLRAEGLLRSCARPVLRRQHRAGGLPWARTSKLQ